MKAAVVTAFSEPLRVTDRGQARQDRSSAAEDRWVPTSDREPDTGAGVTPAG